MHLKRTLLRVFPLSLPLACFTILIHGISDHIEHVTTMINFRPCSVNPVTHGLDGIGNF
jgi:hypothetical protein